MQPESDAQLLRAYAERGAETAFTELVHRHTNLVYSAAWRQVESAEDAAEIAQSVFIGLARGAQSLVPRLAADASLAGWLCRSARNLSLNHRRDEFRRQTRERQAMEQIIAIPDAAPDWNHLRRVLDDVMAELDEPDYDALVLRYFQQQDFRAVGVALGVSDDTAQKRVARALEKLRDQLSRRGISTPAAALSIVISANAVQAAPAGLAATISTAALLTGTAVHTSTVIAAIKTIAMTTLQKTLVTVTVAALAGAGIYEARQAAQLREQNHTLQQSQAPLAEQIQQLQRERDDATNQVVGLRDELAKGKSNNLELLKLRGENTVLRNETTKADDPFVKQALQWKANETKLRKLFEDHPEKRVPELALVSDDQWLGIAKHADLNSETGIRKAQSEVRHSAKNNFMPDLMSALNIFVNANDGVLPTDLNQLQPYFKQPVDEAILQQYKLTATGKYTSGFVVRDKTVIDSEYDDFWQAGPNGYGPDSSERMDASLNTNMEILKPVIGAFMTANQGGTPAAISQLKPFITTPEQQTAFNQLLKQGVNFGQPK